MWEHLEVAMEKEESGLTSGAFRKEEGVWDNMSLVVFFWTQIEDSSGLRWGIGLWYLKLAKVK